MTVLCLCLDCQYFKGVENGELVCGAYPEGIPEEIYFDLEEGQECRKGYHFVKGDAAGQK